MEGKGRRGWRAREGRGGGQGKDGRGGKDEWEEVHTKVPHKPINQSTTTLTVCPK